jgi:hypothetical protein
MKAPSKNHQKGEFLNFQKKHLIAKGGVSHPWIENRGVSIADSTAHTSWAFS